MTPERNRVAELIREAFAGVTLGDGVGLRQGQGLDDYDDPETVAKLRERDEKDDWSRIPVAELNACHSSLSFFDAAGMRFHLPAFLIAELDGSYGFGIVFHLVGLDDYSLGKFTLLSDEQRGAIREFLLHIKDDNEYAFERPQIVRALREYWV
jgi:hypothetical protein